MILTDKIYGKFEIKDKDLIDFIKSKSVQRLKKINQFGIPDRYYHLKNYSRYDHSIGVMQLLRILGASKEEQIAGLLHDISHTAFSHVIDWVVGSNVTEDYQDKQHKELIYNSELKKIAKRHGYSLEKILDCHNFCLLEKESPDLCADRVDYSLKEFPVLVARYCLENIENKNGKIVLKDEKSAYIFATNFLKRQKEHWGGFEAVTRYALLSEALKTGIENKIIKFEDFLKHDEYIIDKLLKSENKKILQILNLLRNKKLKSSRNFKIYHKKFRFVDPEFLNGDEICRLSECNKKFKALLESSRKENEKGMKVPIYNLN